MQRYNTSRMDPTEFENKYFIDGNRHNCPYCGVRSIGYSVTTEIETDWSNEKRAYIYITECFGCRKGAMHLSYFDFNHSRRGSNCFAWPPRLDFEQESNVPVDPKGYPLNSKGVESYEPDPYFFYHKPFSKFTVDPNVPEKIRELVEEAEGCKNQNFMVGASGALRKAIYEFLLDQQIPKHNKAGKSIDYENRIKLLKNKYPKAEEEIFDALASIQNLTSGSLHEDESGNWEPWSYSDFAFVIEVVKSVLYEVYAARQKIRSMISRVNKLMNKSSLQKLKSE